jgi:hypothetical protein
MVLRLFVACRLELEEYLREEVAAEGAIDCPAPELCALAVYISLPSRQKTATPRIASLFDKVILKSSIVCVAIASALAPAKEEKLRNSCFLLA